MASQCLMHAVPNFLSGWDILSGSFFCQLAGGECFDFGADMTRLNGVGLGRVAPSHHLICVSHCRLQPPPFLFSPLPFVCLTLLFSIWPTIDKTQSLTMLGAQHRIGGDGAHALWRARVCSGSGMETGCNSQHCLSTFPLPDGTQQKECASWHTLAFSPSVSSLSLPLPPPSISPVAPSGV